MWSCQYQGACLIQKNLIIFEKIWLFSQETVFIYMVKNLVIVESPAKAKTIEGYLGKDFIVKSSFGHVRDLPKDNNAIDIKNGFRPTYVVSEDKKEVVAQLRKLAKEAETVWLASDDDREGEAISWHLSEALDLTDAKTRRIVFREITKNAILNAIESPRTIDINRVNAQQARRVLDRLVGFELSPILWKKIKTGLSAGRVQSVAVRLVVEREREIERFKSESTFKVVAYLSVITHFEPFAKGVIDTKDVIFYLSMIFFGLFLTARSMESLRWRA